MCKKLKIAIIVKALVAKGPVFVALDVAAGLMELGHSVVVFYVSDCSEIKSSVPHRRITLSSLNELDQFDVVHSHSFYPDLYSAIYSIGRLRFGRSVTTIHNYISDDLKLEYNRVVAFILEYSWRCIWRFIHIKIVLGENMRKYYKQSVIGFDSKVVRNGRARLIGGKYQNELDMSIVDYIKGKIVLGTVCNVVARKGLNQIIKVLSSNKNFILMIVGDGPELVNLKNMAKELNVESQLLLVGHQLNPAPFFKYFDVFMIPSHSEGMPLAMLEAASVGLPIVSSDIPTLLEMFTLDEVSFFRLNDICSLEHSIHNALEKKEIFSRNVKVKFDNCYSLERMSASYLAVYQELVQ